MRWYRNRKISAKLMIGFAIVAFLAALIGIVGAVNLSAVSKAGRVMYEDKALGLQYTGQATTYYQRVRYNAIKGLLAENEESMQECFDKISNYEPLVLENLNSLNGCMLSDEDKALYDAVSPAWEAYTALIDKLIALALDGKKKEAVALVYGDIQDAGNTLQQALDDLTAHVAESAGAAAENNDKKAVATQVFMLAITLACVIVSVLLGTIISRMIGRPISDITLAADRLALGDVDFTLDISTKDEVGRLSDAFNRVITASRRQAEEIMRLSEGDLTVESSVRSEKDILNKSLGLLISNLNELVSSIKGASEQVLSGAKLIADSSVHLSEGATEQASSVEQLTASIQEIASQTGLNAENAESASLLVNEAKLDAENGNRKMHEMLEAMERINNSSSSINKIIKVIDDIAFQTNILALNAAVEAARAGQHGKGFAVVAEEVRNLSAKSSQAAKETNDLIEESFRSVETGARIAAETAETLNTIVGKVSKAAELAAIIATASKEQASAVEQINQGVTQISAVVQGNAATAEESAAASEELSGQAARLNELIGAFRIKKSHMAQGKAEQAVQAVSVKQGLNEAGTKSSPHANPKRSIELDIGGFGKY